MTGFMFSSHLFRQLYVLLRSQTTSFESFKKGKCSGFYQKNHLYTNLFLDKEKQMTTFKVNNDVKNKELYKGLVIVKKH